MKDVTADKPSTHDASSHKVQINDDYYEVLDEFTEADDGELEKINHVKMVICGSNQHKYKCTNCGMLWRFFSQAEHHHIEHEFTKTKHIREVLKDAELERTKDLKSLKKIEKIAGTAKASKALQTLDRITSNLRTRLDAVNTGKAFNKVAWGQSLTIFYLTIDYFTPNSCSINCVHRHQTTTYPSYLLSKKHQ